MFHNRKSMGPAISLRSLARTDCDVFRILESRLLRTRQSGGNLERYSPIHLPVPNLENHGVLALKQMDLVGEDGFEEELFKVFGTDPRTPLALLPTHCRNGPKVVDRVPKAHGPRPPGIGPTGHPYASI